MKLRLLRTLIAAVLLALGLSATSAQAVPAAPTLVALGDSFASGPLIPVQSSDPWGCLRSDHNYAHQLAAELGLPLTDVTCSGATTKDMWRRQNVSPEKELNQHFRYGGGGNPPQLDSVTPDADIVTLQIGGNDVGFGSIATSCGRDAMQRKPCSARYQDADGDKLHRKISATGAKVQAVLQGIHTRAPEARVVVLGYPGIFSVKDPPNCPAMGVGESDARYLRDVQLRLNAMIAAEAAAAGFADYVDVYSPSAGHTACDTPIQRWVEPIVPVHAAAPVHPNLTGMTAIKDILVPLVCTRHREPPPPTSRGHGRWTCPRTDSLLPL